MASPDELGRAKEREHGPGIGSLDSASLSLGHWTSGCGPGTETTGNPAGDSDAHSCWADAGQEHLLEPLLAGLQTPLPTPSFQTESNTKP